MITDIVNMVFSKLDMELEWRGEGIDELGIVKKTGNIVTTVNKSKK